VFGPIPRDYRTDIPRKVKQLARKSALNARAREGALHVVEQFAFRTPKTARLAALLASLGTTWEIANLTFKPYPCGSIAHPYMDCALRLRERHRVTPQPARRERDALLALAHDHAVAERVAEVEERLPEAAPCPGLIGVGPEEGQQRVAALGAVGRGERQVGEQSEALGLHRDRLPD
jgi:hypothetical protein